MKLSKYIFNEGKWLIINLLVLLTLTSAHPGQNARGNTGCVNSSTLHANSDPQTFELECKKSCHNVTRKVTFAITKEIVVACTETSLKDTSKYTVGLFSGKVNQVCKKGLKAFKHNVTVLEKVGDYYKPVKREILIECKKD